MHSILLRDGVSRLLRMRLVGESIGQQSADMTAQIQTIGIAGAGAWGTALANAAAIAGNDVVLWMRSPEQAAALAATRSNARFLPGVPLHDRIRADRRSRRALAATRAVLLVTPAQTTREMTAALVRASCPPQRRWCSAPRASSAEAAPFSATWWRRCAPARQSPCCPVPASPTTWRAACRPP